MWAVCALCASQGHTPKAAGLQGWQRVDQCHPLLWGLCPARGQAGRELWERLRCIQSSVCAVSPACTGCQTLGSGEHRSPSCRGSSQRPPTHIFFLSGLFQLPHFLPSDRQCTLSMLIRHCPSCTQGQHLTTAARA